MKILLISLAFVGANAMACPDAAKDASASRADKPAATVAKAKPTAPVQVSTKTVTKVAVKSTADARKPL